ncbi:MAG: hypothetical protein P4M11_09310 [Candidatus Pacebacteria bacterium]|nr:hypothetical protein [Candidatus Paceibacterota bacterium]
MEKYELDGGNDSGTLQQGYDTFVPFNPEYYRFPGAELELTADERWHIVLLNKVR